MKLIDADKLCEYANNLKDKTVDANDIMRFPKVDAVEVVRCENCIWHDPTHPHSTIFYNSFFCKLWHIFSKPDHFCESGIRKENK